MTVTYHRGIIQGTEEWHGLRLGKLTASEMKHIITPKTLKIASNDKERAHLYTLLAQRAAGYVEPGYTSDEMFRGYEDEIDAKQKYQANYGPIEDCGFIENDRWGYTIGYSPDALAGSNGLIEIKSRAHKFQAQTIIENVAQETCPEEFLIQVQTGLLVAEDREWCDFISYSAGLMMATIKIHPDPVVHDAIVEVSGEFERRLSTRLAQFHEITLSGARLLATERRVEQEIHL